VDVRRVVVIAFGLWIAAGVVGGVHLADDLDGLARVGTLLVVALLFTIVDALATGVRRAVRLLIEPLPLTIAAAVAVNGLLVWLTAALAGMAGLAFSIDGFVSAVLAWLILGGCLGARQSLLTTRASAG